MPEDGPRVRGVERGALSETMVGTPEGELVAALRALLARASEPEVALTLGALLERLPAAKLCLILSENHRHRFLAEAETDALCAALPLARLPELVEELRADAGAILLRAALGDEQLWQVLSTLVRLQPAEGRPAAFEEQLRRLAPERAAAVVAAQFDDEELRVYWVLFPAAVRAALVRLGRGPVWRAAPTAASASTARRRHRSPRGARSAPAREDELQTALRLMSRFGFRESMSYEEARHRYRQLVYAWHPDRAGNNPTTARRIRDLNYGWNLTRTHFAGSAC